MSIDETTNLEKGYELLRESLYHTAKYYKDVYGEIPLGVLVAYDKVNNRVTYKIPVRDGRGWS